MRGRNVRPDGPIGQGQESIVAAGLSWDVDDAKGRRLCAGGILK